MSGTGWDGSAAAAADGGVKSRYQSVTFDKTAATAGRGGRNSGLMIVSTKSSNSPAARELLFRTTRYPSGTFEVSL